MVEIQSFCSTEKQSVGAVIFTVISAASDFVLFLAYLAIACELFHLAYQRLKSSPHRNEETKIVWLFLSFIGWCGLSHLFSGMLFWSDHSAGYAVTFLIVKIITAAVSSLTAVVLPALLLSTLTRVKAEFEGMAAKEISWQAQEAARTRIIGYLCHELRNPLHVVSASMEELRGILFTSRDLQGGTTFETGGQLLQPQARNSGRALLDRPQPPPQPVPGTASTAVVVTGEAETEMIQDGIPVAAYNPHGSATVQMPQPKNVGHGVSMPSTSTSTSTCSTGFPPLQDGRAAVVETGKVSAFEFAEAATFAAQHTASTSGTASRTETSKTPSPSMMTGTSVSIASATVGRSPSRTSSTQEAPALGPQSAAASSDATQRQSMTFALGHPQSEALRQPRTSCQTDSHSSTAVQGSLNPENTSLAVTAGSTAHHQLHLITKAGPTSSVGAPFTLPSHPVPRMAGAMIMDPTTGLHSPIATTSPKLVITERRRLEAVQVVNETQLALRQMLKTVQDVLDLRRMTTGRFRVDSTWVSLRDLLQVVRRTGSAYLRGTVVMRVHILSPTFAVERVVVVGETQGSRMSDGADGPAPSPPAGSSSAAAGRTRKGDRGGGHAPHSPVSAQRLRAVALSDVARHVGERAPPGSGMWGGTLEQASRRSVSGISTYMPLVGTDHPAGLERGSSGGDAAGQSGEGRDGEAGVPYRHDAFSSATDEWLIEIDLSRFSQILDNAISNAAKATKEGEISVWIAQVPIVPAPEVTEALMDPYTDEATPAGQDRDDDPQGITESLLYCIVEDSGCGLPPGTNSNHLFVPFVGGRSSAALPQSRNTTVESSMWARGEGNEDEDSGVRATRQAVDLECLVRCLWQDVQRAKIERSKRRKRRRRRSTWGGTVSTDQPHRIYRPTGAAHADDSDPEVYSEREGEVDVDSCKVSMDGGEVETGGRLLGSWKVYGDTSEAIGADTTLTSKGSGLGLPVCRMLAAAMRGWVDIADRRVWELEVQRSQCARRESRTRRDVHSEPIHAQELTRGTGSGSMPSTDLAVGGAAGGSMEGEGMTAHETGCCFWFGLPTRTRWLEDSESQRHRHASHNSSIHVTTPPVDGTVTGAVTVGQGQGGAEDGVSYTPAPRFTGPAGTHGGTIRMPLPLPSVLVSAGDVSQYFPYFRVLVVDDDLINTRILTRYLRRLGVEDIVVHHDGDELWYLSQHASHAPASRNSSRAASASPSSRRSATDPTVSPSAVSAVNSATNTTGSAARPPSYSDTDHRTHPGTSPMAPIDETSTPMATSSLTQRPFDIMFLDIVMQRMHGTQVMQEIFKCDPPAPVIAATGNVDAGSVREFKELGFAETLGKPYSMDDVRDVLKRYSPQHPSAPSTASNER